MAQSIAEKPYVTGFVEELFPAIVDADRYPEFYKKRLERFSGIPKLDSFHLVTRNMDMDLYLLDLYTNNAISGEEFSERVSFDTVGISPKNIRYSFNAVSGFKNGEQILIADLNNNLDFGDEKVHSFPIESSFSYSEPASLENLPVVDFKYQTLKDNKLVWVNRKIQFYPNPKHPFTYIINELVDPVQNRYTTMLLLKDYWVGKKTLEEVPFNINIEGFMLLDNPLILFIPDAIDQNHFSRDNFEYGLQDTLSVNDHLFRIDSLDLNLNLFITDLGKKELSEKGRRIGEKMDDYVLKDLKGGEFRLSGFSDKDYLLIDFWGTWCAPCKKLTPDIKQLYAQHSEKFDLLSIAVDRNVESVQSYVSKNGMDWSHAYLRMDNRTAPIRKELKVNTFPTFILLDKEHKILIRGNSASFEEITAFLKSN